MSGRNNTPAAEPGKSPRREPTHVTLEDLASLGQVFQRPSRFDWDHIAVVNYIILTADRKYSLTTYNGSPGKSQGRTVEEAMGAGYPLADAAAERVRLVRRGYTLAAEPTDPPAPGKARRRRKGAGR